MRYHLLILTLLPIAVSATFARADIPPGVKCAILAQEKARNMGSEYRQIYKRKFELCMLNSMPREQQTAYLIEKLKPYEAISPGSERQNRSTEPVFKGTWVRVSPNHWVLERD